MTKKLMIAILGWGQRTAGLCTDSCPVSGNHGNGWPATTFVSEPEEDAVRKAVKTGHMEDVCIIAITM